MGSRSARARHVEVDGLHPDLAVIDQVAASLRAGSLVAFPTETVYGLGAAIDRPDALARIFEVKGRPATDPLIVHVADLESLVGVVAEIPAGVVDLADAFWPGPLTVVLPRGRLVGDAVTASGPTVGVRVPAHPVAERLLRAVGVGIAAPSANRFGHVSPTTAAHVLDDLGSRLGSADVVLDGGATPLGIESTVVDLSGARPAVLRHGGVPIEDLVAVLGEVDGTERRVAPEGTATAAPGGLLRHYAPDTPLVLVEGDLGLASRLLDALHERRVRPRVLDLPAAAERAATVLYSAMREIDAADVDLILAVALEPKGLGRGVNDRLFRAAHGRVVIDDSDVTVERLVAQVSGRDARARPR
ncbi:MAG: threonylcarbamoyl-AMP synthase [Actinobacteria bacterium]|nr:threonylcarbamoyl-AMP synthase [Actinomycetota bacterium]